MARIDAVRRRRRGRSSGKPVRSVIGVREEEVLGAPLAAEGDAAAVERMLFAEILEADRALPQVRLDIRLLALMAFVLHGLSALPSPPSIGILADRIASG
jgi:hypothetical protein